MTEAVTQTVFFSAWIIATWLAVAVRVLPVISGCCLPSAQIYKLETINQSDHTHIHRSEETQHLFQRLQIKQTNKYCSSFISSRHEELPPLSQHSRLALFVDNFPVLITCYNMTMANPISPPNINLPFILEQNIDQDLILGGVSV